MKKEDADTYYGLGISLLTMGIVFATIFSAKTPGFALPGIFFIIVGTIIMIYVIKNKNGKKEKNNKKNKKRR
jgi:hypothetical protein